MTIINKISKVGIVSKTKPSEKFGNWFVKNPEGALAGVTVGSIIAKDGVGCVMYVTQSLNNKRIPDDKRKFVAALDLTNGLLMILAQIGMFFAMRKYSGPIFNKLFSKSFNKIAKSNTISRMRMKAAKAGEVVAKKLKIEKSYDKLKKDGLDLFKFIADIAAATIVGKRVIVPLIATPAASKVEKWMTKRDAKKNGTLIEEDKKSKPTMTGKPKEEPVEKEKEKEETIKTEKKQTTNLLEQYVQNK